jgi:hypothetical protein
MILGCLVVERMIAEWWRRRNPAATDLPVLDVMLSDLANALTSTMSLSPIDGLLRRHAKYAKLYGLQRGHRLPLLTDGLASGRRFIFTTLHNLRVFRNYSAHHDCLDFELTFGRDGARAMKVMVRAVVLLLCLPY